MLWVAIGIARSEPLHSNSAIDLRVLRRVPGMNDLHGCGTLPPLAATLGVEVNAIRSAEQVVDIHDDRHGRQRTKGVSDNRPGIFGGEALIPGDQRKVIGVLIHRIVPTRPRSRKTFGAFWLLNDSGGKNVSVCVGVRR